MKCRLSFIFTVHSTQHLHRELAKTTKKTTTQCSVTKKLKLAKHLLQCKTVSSHRYCIGQWNICKYVQGWLLWDSQWNDCCCELLQSFLTVLQTSILFYCLFLASDKPLLWLLANALTPGSIQYSQTRKLLTMYRGFNPKSSTPSTSTEKMEGED